MVYVNAKPDGKELLVISLITIVIMTVRVTDFVIFIPEIVLADFLILV
jgi:hypothetical protein